ILLSALVSPEYSLPPQLIEICLTPMIVAAYCTALYRSVLLLDNASTRKIWAYGAMACAHSMSSAASWAQPQFPFGVPKGVTFVKQAPPQLFPEGSLNWFEKVTKSWAA